MKNDYQIDYHKRYYTRVMTSFINRLKRKSIEHEEEINNWLYKQSSYTSEDEPVVDLTEYAPINLGDSWLADTAYFKSTINISDSFVNKKLYFRFDNDGECLLFVNGKAVRGINPGRNIYMLADRAVKNETYELCVESCLRMQQYVNAMRSGTDYARHIFKKASLFTVNEELAELMTDIECVYEYYLFTEDEACRELLDMARLRLKPDDNIENIMKQIPYVKSEFQIYFEKGIQSKQSQTIYAVGHSHLDLSYLWPIRETVRKCCRTFSNMLDLMENDSDFHYTQSQMMLFKWAKQYYPDVYEKILSFVKKGNIEVIGGMLVETDCNVPSGESIIRQFYYGNKFSKKEFGILSGICWLPDTFGYSAILPQIIKKSGLQYFYTAKITKNTVNAFPYNVFNWEGIDGTSVIGVIDTFSEYAGNMSVSQIKKGLKNYTNKKSVPDVMYVYGNGDGGGGVTKEMIDHLDRFNKMPGFPKMKMSSAADYFNIVLKKAASLNTWSGEIYFEWHQGTYTSQAQLKKYNRQFEKTVRDAEIFASLAGMDKPDFIGLDEAWENVLFNQFHDILTGTTILESISIVVKKYRDSLKFANEIREKYLNRLVGGSSVQGNINAAGEASDLVIIWNTLSFVRDGEAVLQAPSKQVQSVVDLCTNNKVGFIQTESELSVFAENVNAIGYRIYKIIYGEKEFKPYEKMASETESDIIINNEALRILIDKKSGVLKSVFDKSQNREALKGQGNCFELFSEIYEHYCAWNIEPETLRQSPQYAVLKSIELIRNDEHRAEVKIQLTISNSTIVQILSVVRGSRRIDFKTNIDWNENCMLLKVAFDTTVLSQKAVYDLSYGNLERSTKTNTSWDTAKIEVCAHDFVDLSEAGFGASILNDCKYGHDIKNGEMRLTLLKAPKYPYDKSDLGSHEFTYSFYVHQYDFRAGNTDKEALALNSPLIARRIQAVDSMTLEKSYIRIDADGIYIGACIPREDGFVLRIYENHGATKRATVAFDGLAIREIFECDMSENKISESFQESTQFSSEFTPYEIKTFFCKTK